MEFFEKIEKIGKLGKSIEEKAQANVAKLARAIADLPDQSHLDVSNYLALFAHRVTMAKRAYAKAMEALADDNFQTSIEHSDRGLLHLQIAHIHGATVIVPLSATDLNKQTFPSGGCEEIITILGDSLCRIKLLVEYKGINLDKNLKERLALIVLNLQDAIENYARADHSTAVDTAIGALTWCQYIYGRLAKESILLNIKNQTKSLKDLYQAAADAGSACADAAFADAETREQICRMESFLQEALESYLDGNNSELDKFLKLIAIESTSIKHKLSRLATKNLTADSKEDYAQDGDLYKEHKIQSFKEISLELDELLERYHPRPHKARVALHALNINIASLRRLIKAESWAEARPVIQSCRYEYDIILGQIQKMLDPI